MHSATGPADVPVLTLRRVVAAAVWYALIVAEAVLVTRRWVANDLPALPELIAVISTVLVAALATAAYILRVPGASCTERRQALVATVLITAGWGIPATGPARGSALGIVFAILAFQTVLLAVNRRRYSSAPSPMPGKPSLLPSTDTRAVSTFSESSPVASGSDSWTSPAEPHQPPEQSPPAVAPTLQIVSIDDETADDASEETDVAESDEDLFSPELGEFDAASDQTQWYSRFTRDDSDRIEGWIRVDFQPGQREATVHLSFCPPMRVTPAIDTEDLDGTGVEIRVAASFTFGARLSVRRSGPALDPAQARVGFAVEAPVDQQVA